MQKVLRTAGRILLSVPWFYLWPLNVWRWAAQADQVPMEDRQNLRSLCFAGLGILILEGTLFLIAPWAWDYRLPEVLFAYTGLGIKTVWTSIALSRTYRWIPPPLQIEAPKT